MEYSPTPATTPGEYVALLPASRAERRNELSHNSLPSGSYAGPSGRVAILVALVDRLTRRLCDTYPMQSPLQAATGATDPKSVKVNLTTGTGVDIEWNDGHVSHYNFVYLRDACPCAMCEDERGKAGRRPGDPAAAKPGALLIFKPHAKPLSAEGVGKYAIKFSWNDDHDLGLYSWKFLREICPCSDCNAARASG